MCEIFDGSWEIILGLLLVFSILTVLLRVKFSRTTNASELPRWLSALLFWSRGGVAISLLLLMVMGFVCAGSPGDITGMVPN